MDKNQLEAEVERLSEMQPFWHDIELPYGVRTVKSRARDEINHNLNKWERMRALLDPANKRVLDVGCNEGFFSIEMSKAGASEVSGVDIDELRILKANFVANALEVKNVKFEVLNIYEMEERSTKFDIALALGLLHRVPDPYTLIRKLAEASNLIYFEWAASVSSKPIMEFWGGDYKYRDIHSTGYWKPSVTCVESILERHGFKHHYRIVDAVKRPILISSREPNQRLAKTVAREKHSAATRLRNLAARMKAGPFKN